MVVMLLNATHMAFEKWYKQYPIALIHVLNLLRNKMTKGF